VDKKKIRSQLFELTYSSFFRTKELIKKSIVSSITINKSNILIKLKNNLSFILSQHDFRQTHLEALTFGYYENELILLISKILKNKKIPFFDIGANNGFVSLNVKQNCKKISTYCFEPNKQLFNELKSNIFINNLKNVNVYNYGLSEKPGNKKLFFDENGNIGGSLSKSKKYKKFIKCNFSTLDKFVIKKKILPYLIKCDVEGAELLILKGGVKTLQKYKPILILEILRKHTKNFKYNSNDIIDFLNRLEYACYKITKKKLYKISKIEKHTKETNFLFINKVKEKKIINKLNS
jgi:FkbM family methyltransferase